MKKFERKYDFWLFGKEEKYDFWSDFFFLPGFTKNWRQNKGEEGS